MFKLKKTNFIVKLCKKTQFSHKFILTNSLSHEESLILKVPFEREQFHHDPLDYRQSAKKHIRLPKAFKCLTKMC